MRTSQRKWPVQKSQQRRFKVLWYQPNMLDVIAVRNVDGVKIVEVLGVEEPKEWDYKHDCLTRNQHRLETAFDAAGLDDLDEDDPRRYLLENHPDFEDPQKRETYPGQLLANLAKYGMCVLDRTEYLVLNFAIVSTLCQEPQTFAARMPMHQIRDGIMQPAAPGEKPSVRLVGGTNLSLAAICNSLPILSTRRLITIKKVNPEKGKSGGPANFIILNLTKIDAFLERSKHLGITR